MSRQQVILQGTALTFLIMSSFSLGEGPAKAPSPEDDKQKFESKTETRSLATSTDFGQELGLPFPSLNTLGARIETARRTPDPVALGHAANELAVAEKVAGKKAKLTANTLWNESLELAKRRRQVAELQAMQHLAGQIDADDKTVAEIKAALAGAQEHAQKQQDVLKQGKEPRSDFPRLTINNYTGQDANIYVNGHYAMTVPAYQSKTYLVEHHWDPTVVTGYGLGATSWGPRYIWGKFKHYTWDLT